MVPGVSRSGASIVGGMTQKLSRTTAAEFSFFLPGSTNYNSSGLNKIKNNKHSLLSMGSNPNNIKINLKKIQFNFKQLIDTIITLINDKKN